MVPPTSRRLRRARRERGLVLACLVVLPPEVVEQGPDRVGGAFVRLRDVDALCRPRDSGVAVGRDEGGHVGRVGGDEVLLRAERASVGGLEQRACRFGVAAGAADAPRSRSARAAATALLRASAAASSTSASALSSASRSLSTRASCVSTSARPRACPRARAARAVGARSVAEVPERSQTVVRGASVFT